MNQLSAPLEGIPHFDLQPFAFSDPRSDSGGLNESVPRSLQRADAISSWPLRPQPINQGGNRSGLQSAFGSLLGFGGIGSLVQQLIGLLQRLIQMVSGSDVLQSYAADPSAAGSEEYFRQATAGSTGDPHLSFNGVDRSSHVETSRFDSMTDHPNLLDSNSFQGGYRISTEVTSPNPNGVTLNQRASISTSFDRTSVSLESDGKATITRSGQTRTISPGQTLDLGNGQTVSKKSDGSLTVENFNESGGKIATTLTPNSSGGVDVSADATGVDLGGDLVAAAERAPQFWFPPLPNNLRVSHEPPPQFGPMPQ